MLDTNLMLKPDFSRFGLRLKYALNYNKITEINQQLMTISKDCKVTIRTAKKYLNAEKSPGWLFYNRRLDYLCKSLNIDEEWLYMGRGYDPMEYSLMKSMEKMSEYQKNKIFRLSIRLLNNDIKVHRLIELRDKGFISHEHFFSQL